MKWKVIVFATYSAFICAWLLNNLFNSGSSSSVPTLRLLFAQYNVSLPMFPKNSRMQKGQKLYWIHNQHVEFTAYQYFFWKWNRFWKIRTYFLWKHFAIFRYNWDRISKYLGVDGGVADTPKHTMEPPIFLKNFRKSSFCASFFVLEISVFYANYNRRCRGVFIWSKIHCIFIILVVLRFSINSGTKSTH